MKSAAKRRYPGVPFEARLPDILATPIIQLTAVTLTLPGEAGPVNILRGIDMTVGAGESLAIVGPSGSGKTSLLMILGGIERPSAGTVMVAGASLGALGEDALARFRRDSVGIVFQGFHLVPTMTALENVADAAGIRRSETMLSCSAREAACLRGAFAHRRLTTIQAQMSGGEQQRVALARAFAAGPRLILADEPTGNLDRATGEQIMDPGIPAACRGGHHARLGHA